MSLKPENIKYLNEQIKGIHFFHTKDKVEILNSLKEKFGKEVISIVEKLECEKALKEWHEIAKQTENHTIENLIKLLWEPLRQKGFEYTIEIKENGIQMNCTKCPIFEMAKTLKATDLLLHHTCNIDPYIAEGFNPEIKLLRTKTLMEGNNCCNHFYFYKN